MTKLATRINACVDETFAGLEDQQGRWKSEINLKHEKCIKIWRPSCLRRHQLGQREALRHERQLVGDVSSNADLHDWVDIYVWDDAIKSIETVCGTLFQTFEWPTGMLLSLVHSGLWRQLVSTSNIRCKLATSAEEEGLRDPPDHVGSVWYWSKPR